MNAGTCLKSIALSLSMAMEIEKINKQLKITNIIVFASGGGGNGGGYGGGGNGGGYSEPASSYANKSSGAEGWEDRSYGNSSESSDFENGRSRRKRSVSGNSEISQEAN